MLSKVSADEVFIHYFKKSPQLLRASPQIPIGVMPLDPAGDFRSSERNAVGTLTFST